jgi:type I restriction enzyme M protein
LRRDKVNLDIAWLNDEVTSTGDPALIAREIVEDLDSALEQFSAVAEDLA